MRLLLTEVDEDHTVAGLHRRTGRQHLRTTAEVAGVEAGPVVDTPEAVAADTLAVAVGTRVVADTPVVVAKNEAHL